jgi:plastocyanin
MALRKQVANLKWATVVAPSWSDRRLSFFIQELRDAFGESMLTLRKSMLSLATLVAAGLAPSADAAETGTLKMKFVYGGPPPVPTKVDVNKDQAFCGKVPLTDENLVVNPDNGGLKNVVFYVYTGRGGTKLPDYPAAKNTHTLANDQCRFEPHIVVMQAGDTLTVTNPDAVGHNANMQFLANDPQNFQIPPGGEKSVVVDKSEPAPIPVACNIHPWMKAYIVIAEHPFVGVSNDDGVLEIEGLPAGEEIDFRLFHEGATGSIKEVKINGKTEKLNRNRISLKIKEGMNDLGTIEIGADNFK